MKKHSDPPWYFFSRKSRDVAVAHIFANNKSGAIFTHHYQVKDTGEPNEDWEEIDANFRLVVDATEMLNILEAAIELDKNGGFCSKGNIRAEWMQRVHDVVARIKG